MGVESGGHRPKGPLGQVDIYQRLRLALYELVLGTELPPAKELCKLCFIYSARQVQS